MNHRTKLPPSDYVADVVRQYIKSARKMSNAEIIAFANEGLVAFFGARPNECHYIIEQIEDDFDIRPPNEIDEFVIEKRSIFGIKCKMTRRKLALAVPESVSVKDLISVVEYRSWPKEYYVAV